SLRRRDLCRSDEREPSIEIRQHGPLLSEFGHEHFGDHSMSCSKSAAGIGCDYVTALQHPDRVQHFVAAIPAGQQEILTRQRVLHHACHGYEAVSLSCFWRQVSPFTRDLILESLP